MKKTIVNGLKTIGFLIGLFLVLKAAPLLIGVSTVSGVEGEAVNSMDYLVMGDSEAYRSISPMQLYEEHGYVGYNIGKPGQYLQNGYYKLADVLERQTPKIVFVETNFLFRERNLKTGVEQMIGILTKDQLPIFENHNQWKKMFLAPGTDPVAQDRASINSMKGFNFSKKTEAYSGEDYVKKSDNKKKMPDITMVYLDKLVALSQEKGFKLVFYSSSSPRNWTYAKHNSVAAFTQAHKFDYLDFNLMNDELGIDWSKDTYDKGDHLNLYGAKKLTRSVGTYLAEEGKLVDRRDDQTYHNWEKLLLAYTEKIDKKPKK